MCISLNAGISCFGASIVAYNKVNEILVEQRNGAISSAGSTADLSVVKIPNRQWM